MPVSSPRSRRASVTADDVARAAGVSRWTVSRAFKPGASISQSKRELVLASAERLGYAPDLTAASLSSKRTRLVAVLVDGLDNQYKLPMLGAMTQALQARGYSALVIHINEAQGPEAALMNASQHRIDAAILLGTMFDDEILTAALGAQRLDLIINFARETLDPRAIGISCDNGAAARAIARHALDRGYRRAAILTGPTHVSRTLARATSFRDTMVTAGCPVPAIWSADSLTPEAGRRTVAARLDPASPPQVLFCDTDALALGAIEEIRSRGLRIPRDIGVTGFDDIPFLAQAFDLTTYAQPLAEMSDRVARIVEGSAPEVSDYAFTGTLVVRGSTSARGGQAT